MKLLWCLECNGILSPRADGSWTTCECGSSAIRLTGEKMTPVNGLAYSQEDVVEVTGRDREKVRVIGLNDWFLEKGRLPHHLASGPLWLQWHQHVADRFWWTVYSVRQRSCWAVILHPTTETARGGSLTVRWVDGGLPAGDSRQLEPVCRSDSPLHEVRAGGRRGRR